MKPRRLELDYIAPARRVPWAGIGVLSLALTLAAALGGMYREARSELARLEAAASLVGPLRPARAQSKQQLEEEARAAEAVVRELTLPWPNVIAALERAANREVAVLQLQPDPHSRVLRISAEATSREAMFDYVRRLEHTRQVSDAHIVSHQLQPGDGRGALQFAVQATMKEAR